MYIDGYLLLAIYFISVLALAVSVYALWSLEEIRQYYEKTYDKKQNTWSDQQPINMLKSKGHWN